MPQGLLQQLPQAMPPAIAQNALPTLVEVVPQSMAAIPAQQVQQQQGLQMFVEQQPQMGWGP